MHLTSLIFRQDYNTFEIDLAFIAFNFFNFGIWTTFYPWCLLTKRSFLRLVLLTDLFTDIPILVLNVWAGGLSIFDKSENSSFYATFIIVFNMVGFLVRLRCNYLPSSLTLHARFITINSSSSSRVCSIIVCLARWWFVCTW